MLLTLSAVARYLGISEKTARVIVRDLPAVRVGKRYRYSSEIVESLTKSVTARPSDVTALAK
jgi:excisionase family DNA binding protein